MAKPRRRPVRAMVMAAGAGTRLRPLTSLVPKPMVPVANRPVLEYTLENLRRHGIIEVILNLHSHPEMIRNHFGNGASLGMHLEYSLEPELMGTAGGVKKAEWFLRDGRFLVMSGDGLTDVNLTEMLDFHEKSKSVATMGLKAVDSRFEYGVTLTQKNGRIQKFVEKPNWSDVFSNQVNSGIYIFEPDIFRVIPAGQLFDFGQHVWPRLLKSKKPIFGYHLKEYWCDVGNLSEYRRAQRDMLDGRVSFPFTPAPIRPGIWVGHGTVVERGAHLQAPCLIGRDCRVEKGSIIGPYSILGDRCQIGRNATLRDSILWDDVRVEGEATLDHCILGHRARLAQAATVFDGAVLGPSRE